MYIVKIQKVKLTYAAENILSKSKFDLAMRLCDNPHMCHSGNMKAAAHESLTGATELLRKYLSKYLEYMLNDLNISKCFQFDIDYVQIPPGGLFYLPGTFIKGPSISL